MYVEVKCEVVANGERFESTLRVEEEVWDDPEARKHAENWVRMTLVTKIVEKFPPEISARQVSSSSPWGTMWV